MKYTIDKPSKRYLPHHKNDYWKTMIFIILFFNQPDLGLSHCRQQGSDQTEVYVILTRAFNFFKFYF